MKCSVLTFSGSYRFITEPPTSVIIPKACNFKWPWRASCSLECKPCPRPSTFANASSPLSWLLPCRCSAESLLPCSPGRPLRIMPTCCKEFSVCSTSVGAGDIVVITTVRCSSSVKHFWSKCVKRDLRKGMCCNLSSLPSSRRCLFLCMMRAHSLSMRSEKLMWPPLSAIFLVCICVSKLRSEPARSTILSTPPAGVVALPPGETSALLGTCKRSSIIAWEREDASFRSVASLERHSKADLSAA
mmetsp:Transcript_6053/g.14904  ORF Transcript_6053/g.14904 Transcript_6053/m.14904 type:complete len:244 (-) Transcript_6053:79-810(-)